MAKYRECELKHGRIAMAAMLGEPAAPKTRSVLTLVTSR